METIQIGSYHGKVNVINKIIDYTIEMQGNFNQPYNFMNPTILIKAPEEFTNFGSQFTHVKINDLIYYILDYSFRDTDMIEMRLHLDVLASYSDQIQDMTVNLSRSEFPANKNITDNQLPISSELNITKMNFPGNFSREEENGTFILITGQAGYRTPE